MGARLCPDLQPKSIARPNSFPNGVAEQRRTREEVAAYLAARFVEASDDAAGIARALGDITRAMGMALVARESDLGPESLYKSLSVDGYPTFATILEVVRARGVRLHAEAA